MENKKLKEIIEENQVKNNNSCAHVKKLQDKCIYESKELILSNKRKDLLSKILKLNKLLEKYTIMKRTEHNNIQFQQKLKEKVPQFEDAIKKIKKMKKDCQFNIQNQNEEQDNISSKATSMTRYKVDNLTNIYNTYGKNNKNYDSLRESFKNSFKSIPYSLKTDKMSRESDKIFIKELKQNTIAENERIFCEKISSLEYLLKNLEE